MILPSGIATVSSTIRRWSSRLNSTTGGQTNADLRSELPVAQQVDEIFATATATAAAGLVEHLALGMGDGLQSMEPLGGATYKFGRAE